MPSSSKRSPASSLIGQLPLAAIWFKCKSIESSRRFYADVLGLKAIEVESGSNNAGPANKNGASIPAHFDLGTIRLTLLPMDDGEKNGKSNGGDAPKIVPSNQLVFVVENSIEAVQADLIKRGVKMKPKNLVENSTGKSTWFTDPDGHAIYLWQPPRRQSKDFEEVKDLVDHYESITRALADLREMDIEPEPDFPEGK